jgi:hypothetical protein
LLEECFEIIQDIRAREGAENVSPPLKPVWERLTEMRAKLERLREYLKVRKRCKQRIAYNDVWTA